MWLDYFDEISDNERVDNSLISTWFDIWLITTMPFIPSIRNMLHEPKR